MIIQAIIIKTTNTQEQDKERLFARQRTARHSNTRHMRKKETVCKKPNGKRQQHTRAKHEEIVCTTNKRQNTTNHAKTQQIHKKRPFLLVLLCLSVSSCAVPFVRCAEETISQVARRQKKRPFHDAPEETVCTTTNGNTQQHTTNSNTQQDTPHAHEERWGAGVETHFQEI